MDSGELMGDPNPALCPCGRALHYPDLATQLLVETYVRQVGRTVRVGVNDRMWLVDLHYIALHGIKGSELPELAVRYGFEEVFE